jgi:hypothetical protein
MMYWLAHQDIDDGTVFARPELRRLPVRGNQTIRVGIRGPGGVPASDPQLEVKILAPGEPEANAAIRTLLPETNGEFRVPYEPTAAGEYTVKVTGKGRAADREIAGEATARFLAYPEPSVEALSIAAQPDFLRAIATASGGDFRRIDELPSLLQEILAQKPDRAKPKPNFYPDWRRNHSGAFLPIWLVVFAILLSAEWGLRRKWGIV